MLSTVRNGQRKFLEIAEKSLLRSALATASRTAERTAPITSTQATVSVRQWQGPSSEDKELGDIWKNYFEKEGIKQHCREAPRRLTPMNPYAMPQAPSGWPQHADTGDDNGGEDNNRTSSPVAAMDLSGVESEMAKEFDLSEAAALGMDESSLRKVIPGGNATRAQIAKAILEENVEWGGVHWSERHYSAKHGDVALRSRPPEVQRMLEQSKPLERAHLRKCKPVTAGGVAYPIFYDPEEGVKRPQANIPKTKDAKRARVLHIQSLVRLTGLPYSEVALEFDYSGSEYTVALENLRNLQVEKLSELTSLPKEQCKKTFDKCLGNYNKALKQLNRFVQ